MINQTIKYGLLATAIVSSTYAHAQEVTEPDSSYLAMVDSIDHSFHYQRGTIVLQDGLATIEVPEGYKFMDAEQSDYVLTTLWGNPPSEVLGMLFPEETSPLSDNLSYAVEISYSEEGYIDDEDAAEIEYDELLEEMQSDVLASNQARTAQGYPTLDLVGWAAPPFYDAENKKLHWAKEIKFEGAAENTLNYNIRVLGRKGYLTLNAIGDMDVLPEFQGKVDQILGSVSFNEGHRYGDFNPSVDKIAAYGIGGLIAGKVLAKTGLFVLLLKFWKVIALAVVAGFGVLRKALFSRTEEGQA